MTVAGPRVRWAAPDIGDDEIREVVATLRAGWITMGPRTQAFEEGVARLLGVAHAVATTSGTIALDLALGAMGIGPGDEVVVPAFTYVATANAVMHVGATPVMVDVEPVTLNIDPAAARAAIGPRTQAIIAIDYGGCAADYDALAALAAERNVLLLQDAAHSFGGDYRGRSPGTIGVGATLSFHVAKLITTGEGGMFVTGDAGLAERARTLRNNHRLTDLLAAVGLAQLPKIPRLLARRREAARWYREALADISGITLLPEPSHVGHAYFLFSILCADETARDRAAAALDAAGIETRICWPRPVYRQPAYANHPGPRMPCPVAEDVARRILSLPIHAALTREDVARIASVLRAA
jgi:dTDP-4-amino-4,6-dideoxygalactose transaminase